jgi:hypothetical protein
MANFKSDPDPRRRNGELTGRDLALFLIADMLQPLDESRPSWLSAILGWVAPAHTINGGF